jgi:hypothetical protein
MTHDPSRREAVDLRLRPRGHWDRHFTFNLLKPSVCGTHQVEYLNNCTLCPYCIYVFCISLRTNSDLCHLHKKNWLVFITEMKSVYSAVRTGSLNEAVCAPSFKG